MKAKELRDLLNTLHERNRDFDELNVTVVTNDASVGSISQVGVQSVAPGFDWEAGQLLVRTDTPIIKKRVDKL